MTVKKLRVAVIDIDHVHTNGMIREFTDNPNAELAGIAPYKKCTEDELRFKLQKHTPHEIDLTVYRDYKELLSSDIDIAVICTQVTEYADIVEETLALGINTIIEKPMALTMAEAKRMFCAYKSGSAKLMINWPVAWFDSFRKVKELADAGAVGEVLRVEYRSPATCGPYARGELSPTECSELWWFRRSEGGGSISDYAGYGCLLTTWIAGTAAKRVSGFKKNYLIPFSDVEDYATFTIDFGRIIGIIEASWSTHSNGQIPTGPVVYGTDGTIVADRHSNIVKVYRENDRYRPSCEPTECYTCENLSDRVADAMVDYLLKGKMIHELTTPEFNMKAMAAFDAGIRSCNSGKTEDAYEPFGF